MDESIGLTDFLVQRERWLEQETRRIEAELEQVRGSLAEIRRLRAVLKVEQPQAEEVAP